MLTVKETKDALIGIVLLRQKELLEINVEVAKRQIATLKELESMEIEKLVTLNIFLKQMIESSKIAIIHKDRVANP